MTWMPFNPVQMQRSTLRHVAGLLLGLAVALAGRPGVAQAQQPELRASVFSSGGGPSSDGSVMLQSTVGPALVGPAAGDAYQVNAGFWFQAHPPALVAANQPPTAAQITAPADGTEIVIGGAVGEAPVDADTPFVVTWADAVDPEGDPLTYTWQLATEAGFANLLLSAEAGSTTEYETTLGAVAALLDAAGVHLHDPLTLHHRVLASDGQLTTPSASFEVTLVRGTLTATEAEAEVPTQFRLDQNYPNPFNPSTIIAYALPQAAEVHLAVYDLFGRRVATLVEARQAAGRYEVAFVATRLASGTYIYRLEAGPYRAVGRMLLVK